MEESGTPSVTNRKVFTSYNLHHMFWFLEGKPVVAGMLSAFATTEKWQGSGGLDGQRVEIKLSMDMVADGVLNAIADKLLAGYQLAQLALRILKPTQSWFLTVHKRLDAELTKLTQMKITPKEALILLSEEIIIIFDRFYTICRKHMDFVVKGTQVEYMVWCIWLTLQVHMAMDDFVKDVMKYNVTILPAFICFLMK